MKRFSLYLLTTFLFMTCSSVLSQDLLGSGATAPALLYLAMFESYEQERGINVEYQAIGSGGGRRDIVNQVVDFGASDAFVEDNQLASAPTDPLTGEPNRILHIPAAVVGVMPTYNFEPIFENPEFIRFTGAVLADIYLGNIVRWSDPAIQNLNSNITLPDIPITVVYRSDSSGTTSIFVDYLAKVSPQWASDVSQGPRASVSWPAGFGGDGNGGVSNIVAATPGAIGYVSLEFAVENNLGIGVMQNRSGNFVVPTTDSLAAAADTDLPTDLRATFTDTDIPDGWPIAGFTWILVYENQDYQGRSSERARATINLVRWMLGDGQRFHNELSSGRIIGNARAGALRLLDTVRYGERPLAGQ